VIIVPSSIGIVNILTKYHFQCPVDYLSLRVGLVSGASARSQTGSTSRRKRDIIRCGNTARAAARIKRP
jgi:hypothetical protein